MIHIISQGRFNKYTHMYTSPLPTDVCTTVHVQFIAFITPPSCPIPQRSMSTESNVCAFPPKPYAKHEHNRILILPLDLEPSSCQTVTAESHPVYYSMIQSMTVKQRLPANETQTINQYPKRRLHPMIIRLLKCDKANASVPSKAIPIYPPPIHTISFDFIVLID